MEEMRNCGRLLKQINDELCKSANNAMRSQDMAMAQLAALAALLSTALAFVLYLSAARERMRLEKKPK